MKEAQIAALFRASELQRREARRKIMLNYDALGQEDLVRQEDLQADVEARRRIAEQQLVYEGSIAREVEAITLTRLRNLGYWRRLWLALINKELP